LTADQLAVWSGAHQPRARRRGLQPLTPTEQAEFAPFADVLHRAKAAGFRGRHTIIDSRHGDSSEISEIKISRERAGVVEVIVFRSQRWAQAFRMPAGAALLQRPAELEASPARLLDLVLAGTWPEKKDR
jgi:hypothetical protein